MQTDQLQTENSFKFDPLFSDQTELLLLSSGNPSPEEFDRRVINLHRKLVENKVQPTHNIYGDVPFFVIGSGRMNHDGRYFLMTRRQMKGKKKVQTVRVIADMKVRFNQKGSHQPVRDAGGVLLGSKFNLSLEYDCLTKGRRTGDWSVTEYVADYCNDGDSGIVILKCEDRLWIESEEKVLLAESKLTNALNSLEEAMASSPDGDDLARLQKIVDDCQGHLGLAIQEMQTVRQKVRDNERNMGKFGVLDNTAVASKAKSSTKARSCKKVLHAASGMATTAAINASRLPEVATSEVATEVATSEVAVTTETAVAHSSGFSVNLMKKKARACKKVLHAASGPAINESLLPEVPEETDSPTVTTESAVAESSGLTVNIMKKKVTAFRVPHSTTAATEEPLTETVAARSDCDKDSPFEATDVVPLLSAFLDPSPHVKKNV